MIDINNISGIAVDFGGTKIAAARYAEGVITQQMQVATHRGAGESLQIAAIVDLVKQLSVTRADDIGIAVSGRISKDGAWHAVNAGTLENINAVPLRKILSDIFARPVTVANDAVAAAVGEQFSGALASQKNCGFITVSTGVGGGFIIADQPLISPNGIAGHAGFLTSRYATDICGSGRERTVESIASGRAIARYAADCGHQGLEAKEVFEAHLAGQVWASELIERSAAAIGELCGNLVTILGVEAIALGGSIGLAEGYLQQVQNAVDLEPEIFRPRLVSARMGADAALLGILVLHQRQS